MKHDVIRHKLSEYIDHAVTPEEQAAIDEHLKTCATCVDALAELRKTIEAVKQVEDVEAPAWMTQKIMANVRAEHEKRSGVMNRLFNYFVLGRAIPVVAVLFLTVTAYYIYTSIHPAEKYGEAPVGRIAKQEAPAQIQDAAKGKTPEAAPERQKKKAAHEPGYKSLDMKYSYEKPAPPVPVEQQTAAPAQARHEAGRSVKDGADRVQREAASQALSAPSVMAEQSAPAAGAVHPPAAGGKPAPALDRAAAARKPDREAEARLAVAERFAKTDLPKKMKVKGLFYTIRSIQDDPPDLQWLKDTAAYRSTPCADRYVVDVDLSGSLSKYLYCTDRPRVRLLGIYEFREGAWTEKKRP